MFDTMTAKMGDARFAVTTDERPGTTYYAPNAAEAWNVAFRLVDQGIALESIAVIDRLEA